jgi:hypothetical protein
VADGTVSVAEPVEEGMAVEPVTGEADVVVDVVELEQAASNKDTTNKKLNVINVTLFFIVFYLIPFSLFTIEISLLAMHYHTRTGIY